MRKKGDVDIQRPSMICTIAGNQTMDLMHRSLLRYRLRHIHIYIGILDIGNDSTFDINVSRATLGRRAAATIKNVQVMVM